MNLKSWSTENHIKLISHLLELKDIVGSPLTAVSYDGISSVSVAVRGGGIRGQAEAVRLGICESLGFERSGFQKNSQGFGISDPRRQNG